jgi:hypothetical protein
MDYEFSRLQRNKKFLKENGTQFNQKIRADDRLESAQVPFNQGSHKMSQVQRRQVDR